MGTVQGVEGQHNTANTGTMGRAINKTIPNKDTTATATNKTGNCVFEGACALSEVLKVNTTLTELGLSRLHQRNTLINNATPLTKYSKQKTISVLEE